MVKKFGTAPQKRLLVNFLVPLVTGGIYILIKLDQDRYGHTAALMLIFLWFGIGKCFQI